MKPLVERLQQEYEGKVDFRLYNVETDPTGAPLAQQMGIQYVPTFVFVNADGVTASTTVGGMEEDAMRTSLDALK